MAYKIDRGQGAGTSIFSYKIKVKTIYQLQLQNVLRADKSSNLTLIKCANMQRQQEQREEREEKEEARKEEAAEEATAAAAAAEAAIAALDQVW